jgi:choline-sulfatase
MLKAPRPLLTLPVLLLAGLAGVWLLGRANPGLSPEARFAVRAGERPPSLVLVTLDTTRADRLEPYGATGVSTPTLARLARDGVLFEAAYAVAPITLPSHATIFTGLYPPEHGVRNNGIHFLAPEIETLAERLARRGYQTGAFVSAAVLERRFGLDQGFEVYDDDLSQGRERHPRGVPDRPAEVTVRAAREWLDGIEHARPFFLWVHLYDPHAPYSPPPPWRDRFRDRPYDGEIAYTDEQLGKLLAHARLDAAEEVVVSVLADHGESLGEHGEQTHALLVYDATLRIPWLLRYPGAPPGLRFRPAVDHADVLPTLLGLLGLPSEPKLPGRDLAPFLERGEERRAPPRLLYAETYLPYYTYGWAKLRSARRERFKLIDAPTPELYDTFRDPRELTNQYRQQPGSAHDLRRDLEALLQHTGDAEREAGEALDAESFERLRSLGYLATAGGRVRPAGERPDPKEMVGLHVAIEHSRQLLASGLAREAEETLRGVLARDPGNLAALLEMAQALEARGELEGALQAVERALTADPSNLRLHLHLAGLEARRGEIGKALEIVELAASLDPRSLEVGLQRVSLLRQLGRGAEVEALLAELRGRHPESPRVAIVVAQGELARGEVAAAEALLKSALERDPFLSRGWRLLGEALERQARDGEAMEAYRRGLERQPDDAELHAALGLMLARLGTDPAAEGHLREALRLAHEPRPDLLVTLGGWLAHQGRTVEAEAEYARALELAPGHAAARNNRAIALHRSGRTAEARAELEALVRELPSYADAHNNLAGLAVEVEDWQAALTHARRALELAPGMPEALNNLGLALEHHGRAEEALERYRHALAESPAYWPARFNLGVLLARSGRPREAADELREVLRHSPGYAEAHYELGTLLAEHPELGDQARVHLNAFLRLAPEDPRGAGARRLAAELPRAGPPGSGWP